ncbi:hypothetical protein QFC24_003436 [Naganishia onofrii]|uniref:Uncharacterized protein n=1 Tax=Naganishia onofrii TaxID=1851511 RepID=A0ACC2XJ91_9TREE|nr:hypothetical protein QFC24_003436 [Naganishia onofrii]
MPYSSLFIMQAFVYLNLVTPGRGSVGPHHLSNVTNYENLVQAVNYCYLTGRVTANDTLSVHEELDFRKEEHRRTIASEARKAQTALERLPVVSEGDAAIEIVSTLISALEGDKNAVIFDAHLRILEYVADTNNYDKNIWGILSEYVFRPLSSLDTDNQSICELGGYGRSEVYSEGGVVGTIEEPSSFTGGYITPTTLAATNASDVEPPPVIWGPNTMTTRNQSDISHDPVQEEDDGNFNRVLTVVNSDTGPDASARELFQLERLPMVTQPAATCTLLMTFAAPLVTQSSRRLRRPKGKGRIAPHTETSGFKIGKTKKKKKPKNRKQKNEDHGDKVMAALNKHYQNDERSALANPATTASQQSSSFAPQSSIPTRNSGMTDTTNHSSGRIM